MSAAQCAEHGATANGTCSRCGLYLCPRCSWQGSCVTCYRRQEVVRVSHFGAQDLARRSWNAFFVCLLLVFTRARAFVPLVAVVGVALGLIALIRRRGAPQVVAPALVGIGLNLALLVAIVLLFG